MNRKEILPRTFYLRNTLEVAKDLLGKELVHTKGKCITSGLIVEVEAYIGPADAASHAHGGLFTPRTKIQYENGGRAYIYQIYGKHYCFNVVTQKKNFPEVVLIRALEPLYGISTMTARRNLNMSADLLSLTNGPGKLCQAMGIDLSCYGLDLCRSNLVIKKPEVPMNLCICRSKRINIEYSGVAKDFLWRFYLDNPYVSKRID